MVKHYNVDRTRISSFLAVIVQDDFLPDLDECMFTRWCTDSHDLLQILSELNASAELFSNFTDV